MMSYDVGCHILRLKCTKFDFGWGSALDPAGGAYSALPVPLLNKRGLLQRGRREGEGKGVEMGKERGSGGGQHSLARPLA